MIPKKDIKFVQKQALQMYYEGKNEVDVNKFLLSEGGDEQQANTLAKQFYEDYQFLTKQKTKNEKSSGERDLIIGSVLFLCGSFLTYYLSETTENISVSFFYRGPIFMGAFFIIKGIIAKIRE